MTQSGTRREEFRLSGEELTGKIKELLHEGNVRRIVVRNEEGKNLIEIPLTVALIGIVMVPVWAAIGAVAALVTDCTVIVERAEE